MGKNLRKVVQLIQNSLVGLDYPCSLDSSLFFAGFLADWPCKDADFTIQNREVSWFHSDVILKSHNPSKTVFWAGIDPATPLFFLRGKLLFCFRCVTLENLRIKQSKCVMPIGSKEM